VGLSGRRRRYERSVVEKKIMGQQTSYRFSLDALDAVRTVPSALRRTKFSQLWDTLRMIRLATRSVVVKVCKNKNYLRATFATNKVTILSTCSTNIMVN
jgi:hypothetical protein